MHIFGIIFIIVVFWASLRSIGGSRRPSTRTAAAEIFYPWPAIEGG
jgi:hypothetical protein